MKIQDVAKDSGCSISTVSRVLNNPDLVTPDTRERVLKSIEKLGYYPNEKAKSLSSKKQNVSLGLLIPDITTFYFGELYRGISRTAKNSGIDLILRDLDDEGPLQEQILDGMVSLKKHGVSGIIISSRVMTEEYDEVLNRLRIPIVLALSEHKKLKFSSFKTDDIKASFDAISYLVSRGHKHIGMVTSSPTEDKLVGEPRYQGFKNAIDFYRLPFKAKHVAVGNNFRYEGGYSAMTQLLETRETFPFSAVFCATDEMAFGAMRSLHDHNLKVPDDVSIIGFDNLSISNMITPKLTTVSQSFEKIGVESVNHLIKILEEPKMQMETGVFYMPHQIVERESVRTI
ncbi:LacI family DNA-binding transcriptional regulator [Lederbergia galactosidilytica]|uniref:LacI family DNA-binding transcriptional regulator n=1 Tax=Lederbergia galactosidilytica TaxID=217031 RepID=UPI001EE3CDB8|nr:LacI family DNA-binding transcriptional regulator [Lederbergia galactosidilytica]